MALALGAIALSGWGVYRAGWQDVLRLRLGIQALMAVAVTGAFAIGQWPEAAMVMALYVVAERLEDAAVHRARAAIRQLLDGTPLSAMVQAADGQYQRVPVAEVAVGAVVRVAPGERVPLDGWVLQGHSSANQAPITGESAPVDKAPGDVLYAGSVNMQGELLMHVSARADHSLLARIVQRVEEAQAMRAPTQRFVDRFAVVYTPLVFLMALLLGLLAPWLADWSWQEAVYQALALLVIACPCALVISTPVTLVSALAAAAQRGVLIKGGQALETARRLRCVALDKTGTLTTGHPTLVASQLCPGVQTTHPEAVLQALACALASRSQHPVAQAIAVGLTACAHEWPAVELQEVQALPGRGVQAQWSGQRYALGSVRWAQEQGLLSTAVAQALHAQEVQGHSVSVLLCDAEVLAWYAVADPVRPQARAAVAQLQALGIETVLLSGDNAATVQAVAAQAGIATAQAQLLPEEKLAALQRLQQHYGTTAMVGDGINDAPALAQADIGFAMGGVHSSDMAMDTAAVVLMHDDLRRIAQTVRLSRRTHRVLWQNISLALGVKALFCAMAFLGMATLWLAVLADMGISLLVVANGLRLRRNDDAG